MFMPRNFLRFRCIDHKGRQKAPIGNDAFEEEYVREKVATWVEEVKRLTLIAESQPHAAYAALP